MNSADSSMQASRLNSHTADKAALSASTDQMLSPTDGILGALSLQNVLVAIWVVTLCTVAFAVVVAR